MKLIINKISFEYYFLVGILFFTFFLRIPFLSQPLDTDEGGYAFFAFFSTSAKFYTSLPIGRLPGIILTYRFIDDFFMGNTVAIRVVATSLLIMASFFVYRIGKSLFNYQIGLLSALFFSLLCSQNTFGAGANTEIFMVPFTTASFFYFLQFIKKRKTIWLVISGICAGISIFYKQVSVFEFFYLGLVLIVSNIRIKNYRIPVINIFKIIKESMFFTIPFLIPLLLACLYFYITNQFSDFLWQSFGSGSSYVNNAWNGNEWINRLTNIHLLLFKKLWIFELIGLGGLVICIYSIVKFLFLKKKVISHERSKNKNKQSKSVKIIEANQSFNNNKKLAFIILWLIFALFGTTINGWFFPHYYVQIVPAFSILGGICLYNIILPKKKYFWIRSTIITLLILMFINYLIPMGSFFLYATNKINYKQHLANLGQDVDEAGWLPFLYSGEYLQKKMKPDETIFVWSTTPVSYYYTRKYPTTEYVYNYPFLSYDLMLDTYKGWKFDFENNRKILMREFVANPPDYILFHVFPYQVYQQLSLFKEFGKFIQNNYHLDKDFETVVILKLNNKQLIDRVNSPIPFVFVQLNSEILKINYPSPNETEITYVPMVNPDNIILKTLYKEKINVKFEKIKINKLENIIEIIGPSKNTNFIKIQLGNLTMNSKSFGINQKLSTYRISNNIYIKFPFLLSQYYGQEIKIYIIYDGGEIAKGVLQL